MPGQGEHGGSQQGGHGGPPLRLAEVLRRFRRRVGVAEGLAVDERPRSAFELVTRRGLDDLASRVERLETKVNGLLFGVALTVILQVWTQVLR